MLPKQKGDLISHPLAPHDDDCFAIAALRFAFMRSMAFLCFFRTAFSFLFIAIFLR